MADEKITVDVNVVANTEASIKNLKDLKKLLRSLPADSAEFGIVSNKINDIEDALKGAKKGTADFVDTLASAPGPLGKVGSALNTLKISTVSLGAAFKAAGIGLIVAAIGGIATAFASVEGSGKKLEPLLIGFQKILGGILEVIQPLLDAFLDLALRALPYITKGIGSFYSGLVALFTLVKEAGMGVGKILKGIFTLDTDVIKEGWETLKGSWGKTVIAYEAGVDRFEKGTKKLTKTEKDNIKERQEARDKEYEALVKNFDNISKLQEATLEKAKQIALSLASTEEAKLKVEVLFAEKTYDLQKKNLQDKIKLAEKYGKDTKDLQAQAIKLDADYIKTVSDNSERLKEIVRKANEEVINSRKVLTKAQYDLFQYQFEEAKNVLDQEKATNAKRIGNEADYNTKLAILATERDQKRLDKAKETRDNTNKELDAQFKEGLLKEGEYLNKRIANEQEYTDVVNAARQGVYDRNVTLINDLMALKDIEHEKERELLDLRLNTYKSYADGISAIFNYISGLQRDASEEQVLLAKIAVYIQSAAAVADIILKARAAYASYAKAAATAAATVTEGIALSSNPITAVIGGAMIAAGTAAGGAAKAGMVSTIVGAAAQTAIVAAQTALQIQAIDSAARGSASAGTSGGGGAGGGGGTPAFANATIGAPQIGPTANQVGTIAGIVAGSIVANQSSDKPIKAYVVGNDITTQQQLDRRIRTAARLGG